MGSAAVCVHGVHLGGGCPACEPQGKHWSQMTTNEMLAAILERLVSIEQTIKDGVAR